MELKCCVYLDDIGLKQDNYFANFCYDDETRSKIWEEERKKYGFDSRETWNIDTGLAEWLYTRLKRYQEVSAVDTDRCKYEIDGKEITLTEAIQKVIDSCEFYLLNKWGEISYEEKAYDKMKDALHILENIFPSLWW